MTVRYKELQSPLDGALEMQNFDSFSFRLYDNLPTNGDMPLFRKSNPAKHFTSDRANQDCISDNIRGLCKSVTTYALDAHPEIQISYDVSSISEVLEGIMLSKDGLRISDSNDVLECFCTSCEKNINNNLSANPPKFAIPEDYKYYENRTRYDESSNPAQSNSFAMTVIGGYNRKMSSHAYSFRAVPAVPAALLPRDILMTGEIKVGI